MAGLAGVEPRAWTVGPLRFEAGLVNLILLTYLAGLMWLVTRYCMVNLRGQTRLTRFGALCATITLALGAMVLSGNLTTLAVWWTVSGVAVAGLVAHAGHPSAASASRSVLFWMLASSGVLWAGAIVAGFAGLGLAGRDPQGLLESAGATLVAALVILACLIRSAMVPFQRWLPETAEAPSPVSALLHAGVVNATGVVAVLQWPLLSAQPLVLAVLGLLGVLTVVWCSLEQRVRPDVKGRLAASTSAQMGWMAIQVGVGVPAAALFHLMGHGAWKAWHFLRAGGAVARARREPATRRTPTLGEVATLALLALVPVAIGTVVLGGGVLVEPTPGFALVAGLAVLAAAVIGVETAALERSTAVLRAGVSVIGGLVVTAYLLAALSWDHSLAAAADLPHAYAWWSVAVSVAALSVAAALAVWGTRLHARSTHPTATLVAATSVGSGTRLSRFAMAPTSPGAAAPLDVSHVRAAVETSAKLVGPAWPLRATVAANPLAQLESMPFDTALLMAERFYGSSLRPSLAWFLDLHERGTITTSALSESMAAYGIPSDGAVGVTRFLQVTRDCADVATTGVDASGPERDDDLGAPLAHAHVWTARAWHRAEDTHGDLYGPWHLFKAGASHRVYDVATGCRGASQFVRSLPEDPAAAISMLLALRPDSAEDSFSVVTRLLAAGPGWVAHAQWRGRRCATSGPLLELAALRLALATLHGSRSLSSEAPAAHALPAAPVDMWQVWQRALDRSERDRLLHQISLTRGAAAQAPSAQDDSTPQVSQSVWCIDVRSERFRRNLELIEGHDTYGFAGFFGLLAQTTNADGTVFDQCPVIVNPTVGIELGAKPLGWLPAATRVASRVVARPGVTFAAAEAAGPAAFLSALTSTVAPRQWRRVIDLLAPRGTAVDAGVSLRQLADPTMGLDLAQRTDAAEGMLRSIGLTSGFAPVLLLCAHGSTTENNAYVSAYDCGACGGNPGLVNASAMAGILNDPAVREQLSNRGIDLPDTTRVLAAQHDTTTDAVDIVTPEPADEAAARLVRADLSRAGTGVTEERLAHLPSSGRGRSTQDAVARACDWAEPMPEWGLTGCAAIVVGTRDLTRAADLDGRVFLHSYDRDQDADGAVLSALINAPVVVSQWIASQYWFSTAAPAVLGAGDKTTHNVVGDIGVTTGAHGDLRMGLPWQATFAAAPGVAHGSSRHSLHVPSRHLVVIEADSATIARIVGESAGVRQLVANQWMQVVAVDRGTTHELRPDLTWTAVGRPTFEGQGSR